MKCPLCLSFLNFLSMKIKVLSEESTSFEFLSQLWFRDALKKITVEGKEGVTLSWLLSQH